MDVSFASQRYHIKVKPEVEPVRMNICMHGLLKDCTSEAEILKIRICREIVLIKAVRYKLGGKHLRYFRIGMLYRINICRITGY
jgi:hypothetical protein